MFKVITTLKIALTFFFQLKNIKKTKGTSADFDQLVNYSFYEKTKGSRSSKNSFHRNSLVCTSSSTLTHVYSVSDFHQRFSNLLDKKFLKLWNFSCVCLITEIVLIFLKVFSELFMVRLSFFYEESFYLIRTNFVHLFFKFSFLLFAFIKCLRSFEIMFMEAKMSCLKNKPH